MVAKRTAKAPKRNVNKTTFKKKPKSLMRETASNAPEKKTSDVLATMAIPNGAVTWSPLQHINIVPQGTTGNSRVGRKIQMKSLYLRIIYAQASRIIVVYDRASQNGSATAPLITDILTADNSIAHKNLNNGERFVTLIDDTVKYESTATTGSEFKEYYRKIDLSAMFTSTAGTAAELTTGGVWIMFANYGAATPTGSHYSRIRYTDI